MGSQEQRGFPLFLFLYRGVLGVKQKSEHFCLDPDVG